MRFITTFLTRATVAVFGLAMVALVVFAVGPRTGTYRTLTVLSDSMKPTFAAGDVLVDTPARSSDVQVGDVITFQAPTPSHPIVTHRVIEVVKGGHEPLVRTRGDANDAADPWTARLNGGTIWRQQAVLPGIGAVVRMLRSRFATMVTLFAVPFLLLMLALSDIWRARAARPTALRLAEGDDWTWPEECELAMVTDAWVDAEPVPYDEDWLVPSWEHVRDAWNDTPEQVSAAVS